jgi:hypothetical protein
MFVWIVCGYLDVYVLQLVYERLHGAALNSGSSSLQHLRDRAAVIADEEILEFAPFDTDEAYIHSDPIVKTVEGFLRRHTTSCAAEPINVCVSLSGGVDSMVRTMCFPRVPPPELCTDR